MLNAGTGDPIAKITTNSGAHNTIYSPKGHVAYLAGLKSHLLSIADTRTHHVVRYVGPFSDVIRPFTVHADETLCYVNVNDMLNTLASGDRYISDGIHYSDAGAVKIAAAIVGVLDGL